MPGVVEVDAFSLGVDLELSGDVALQAGTLVFSVDEFAGGPSGFPANLLLPELLSVEGLISALRASDRRASDELP